jgi:hypothetical protein
MITGFVRERNLKHRMLLDGSRTAEDYGVVGLPATLWIDREGIVVDAAFGSVGSKRLHDRTAPLLGRSD